MRIHRSSFGSFAKFVLAAAKAAIAPPRNDRLEIGGGIIYKLPREMNVNQGLALVAPRIPPVLDSSFRPAILANQAFQERVRASGNPIPVRLALEQNEGSVSLFTTHVLAQNHPQAHQDAP